MSKTPDLDTLDNTGGITSGSFCRRIPGDSFQSWCENVPSHFKCWAHRERERRREQEREGERKRGREGEKERVCVWGGG